MSSTVSYIEGRNNSFANGFTGFNYEVLTDGELSVLLAARQLDLFHQSTKEDFYLNASSDLRAMVDFSVNGTEYNQTSSKLSSWAKRTIKSKNYPAITANFNSSKIGNLSYGEYQKGEVSKCEAIKRQWSNTPFINFRKRKELRQSWEGCFVASQYLTTVNSNLEESGAHLLYNFAKGTTTQTIQVKKVLHKIAVENYSSVFGLSVDNIEMWLRNGILSQNIKKDIGAIQPDQTIKLMIENVRQNYDEIGVLPLLVLVKAVLEIVLIALAATQAIISALGPKEYDKMMANTQGLGTAAFGPQKDDFIGEISQQAVESGAIWPLAAAGAFLLLK